jgi:nicotinamidase-related amidase
MTTDSRFEPVTNAVNLCIDMQNFVARGGIWENPWMERVLPVIVEMTAR